MRNVLIIGLLALAAVLPLHAAVGEHQGSDYMVRGMLSLWEPSMSGDFNYADSSSTFTGDASASDLGIDDASSSMRFEAGVNLPLVFDVMVGGYGFEEDGRERLEQSFSYGGTDYLVGTTVETDISIDDLYAEMAFRLSLLNASVTAGLAIHQQAINIKITDGVFTEEFDEDVYFPVAAVRGYVNLPQNITLEGRIHYLSVTIDDFSAKYTEVHALVSWRPLHHIGVFAGYQITQMDLDYDDPDGSEEVKLDYDLQGPFIGVLVQF